MNSDKESIKLINSFIDSNTQGLVNYNVVNYNGQSISCGGGEDDTESFIKNRLENINSDYDPLTFTHTNEKGEAHRLDGPAIVSTNGRRCWCVNGKLLNEKSVKLLKRSLVINKVLCQK